MTTLERKRASMARARKAKGRLKKIVRRKFTPKEPIRPEAVYAWQLVPETLGIGPATLQRFEREGMRTSMGGSKKFVSGKDLIAAIAKSAK